MAEKKKAKKESKELSGKGIFLKSCSIDGKGEFKAGAKFDAAKFSKEEIKALKDMKVVEG